MPARRKVKTAKTARAKSRSRSRRPGAAPAPRHRRKATRLRTARTSGVAGVRTGTVRGRSRKKPRRTAPDRLAAVEKVMGLPVLPERGLDPDR
jgi:hypothetical protein